MNILKPLAWVALASTLYFSGAFTYVASLSQEALLASGLANADDASNSDTPFDFNFTIKDLAGKKIDFNDFKGKVIFLNLWATWCPPCRSEMASIEKLYEGIDKEKISFVMLSLDKDSQFEKVKNYVNKKSFTFPVYMPSGYLSDQLQVPSIPTTFVITKSGKIDLTEIGMKNYNTSKFTRFSWIPTR